MATRIVAALCMISMFSTLIWTGHLAVCIAVIGLQIGIFHELVNLRYESAKEKQMPLFRTIQWAWFFTAMVYAYGTSWLKAPMGGGEILSYLHSSLPSYVTNEYTFLNAVAFVMYSAVFVATVMTLKPGLYDYQLTQLSWTLLSIVLVVAQLKTLTYSVYQGLFWMIFPASLVVANDSFAYFSGVCFGGRLTSRRFLALSPSKTWEGFLGALVLTLLYAYIAAPLFGRWAWLRCSFPELSASGSAPGSLAALGSCRLDWLFLPGGVGTAGIEPVRVLALGLALFASLVAPFGGFFASAVKRACGIKDFAGFIPGHGGFTDRLDCQLIMSLASWVVLTTFVTAAPALQLPLPQLVAAARQLGPADRAALLQALGAAACNP